MPEILRSKDSRHHHGNLRNALIKAGRKLIVELGVDGLSIRKAATMTGVSHAAPKHHFSSLLDFRTAVVADGFRQFSQTMTFEIERANDTSNDRLLAACIGYIQFAENNVEMFNLMFGGHYVNSNNQELVETANYAYAILKDVCKPISRNIDSEEATELMIWSLVHGYASLSISDRSKASGNRQLRPSFEDIFPKLEYEY